MSESENEYLTVVHATIKVEIHSDRTSNRRRGPGHDERS